jgi:hypothetical protein
MASGPIGSRTDAGVATMACVTAMQQAALWQIVLPSGADVAGSGPGIGAVAWAP